jgi:PST family polysaccharide transporter
MGVAVAYVVSMFLLFVPAIAYAGRPLGIGGADVIRIVWRQMFAALIAAGLAFLLRWTVLADAHALVRTPLLVSAYLITYLILVVVVLHVRAPLRTTQSVVRGFLPARLAHLLP